MKVQALTNVTIIRIILRAPSRSRKLLRLAYDSLRLASRLKPASRSFYGGGVSYGGLRRLTADWRIIYTVSQKILTFFPNSWEFLVQILHAYCTFLSTLDYNFLFSYLQLWRRYAILSATTIICSKRPLSVETHAVWSYLIWHNFVIVGDNWIKICSLA